MFSGSASSLGEILTNDAGPSGSQSFLKSGGPPIPRPARRGVGDGRLESADSNSAGSSLLGDLGHVARNAGLNDTLRDARGARRRRSACESANSQRRLSELDKPGSHPIGLIF